MVRRRSLAFDRRRARSPPASRAVRAARSRRSLGRAGGAEFFLQRLLQVIGQRRAKRLGSSRLFESLGVKTLAQMDFRQVSITRAVIGIEIDCLLEVARGGGQLNLLEADEPLLE